MSLLSDGPKALVKRVEWYTRTGRRLAWGLTPVGYAEAATVLETPVDVPRDDISPEFLEHHVLLTDLYVGLLEAWVRRAMSATSAEEPANRRYRGIYARAGHPGFRWNSVGERDLPWRQYQGGEALARLLRPDAILEFPGERRRVFVEAELGTHTVVSASETKTGATMSKVKRYEAYCTQLADVVARRSWYSARFPDGFAPEVLFLVRTEGRARSILEAIEPWRKQASPKCSFVVATVEGAVTQFLPACGFGLGSVDVRPQQARAVDATSDAVAQDAVMLAKDDVALLGRFLMATQSDCKRRRDLARAQKAPMPEYPEGLAQVHALLKRLHIERR
jgi:hypothetical protein